MKKLGLLLVVVLVAASLAAAAPAITASSANGPVKGKAIVTKTHAPQAKPASKNASKAVIFSTDFEANNGGFTMVDGNGQGADNFTWTTAGFPYSMAAPNGSSWWLANADAYNGVNDEYLYSPIIDCGSYQNVTLTWAAAYAFWGSGYIDISVTTDGGSTWTSIYNDAGGNDYGIYPTATVGPTSIPAFTSQASCQIRWHYYDNAWGYGAGVDDVVLNGDNTASNDLVLQSIDQPASLVAPAGVDFTPTVTVYNFGTASQNDFMVRYQIDDGLKALVYQDSFHVTTALDPGNTVQVAMPSNFTPLDMTVYTATAWVELAGDVNNANDTLAFAFRSFPELVGNVSDDNAGGTGLPGVTITVTGPDTQSTTTDGSGDYYFDDLTAGDYTLTAELTGYITETASPVTIVDNMQTTQDLSMGYPVLSLTPTDSIYSILPWGGADSTTWQFIVTNDGTRDLNFDVMWPDIVKDGKAPVSLVLDDGVGENNIGIGGTSEMIWVNRFTPAGGEYPFRLQQVQLYFTGGTTGLAVGHGIQIVIYENTTGNTDPAVGSNFLYSYASTVQALDAWNVYDLPDEVLLNGPGDVVIGAINTYLPGSSYFPAAIDQTVTQSRSWAGAWSTATHPEPPTLPPDDLWTNIDAYFPGNWMVRGYGQTGSGNAVWLNIDPASGTVGPYKASTSLNVTFDAAGLDSLTDWGADVTFGSNAGADQHVPAYLHVVGTTGVAGGPSKPLSHVFALNANRPNPANGRTTFSFSLPKAQDYSLKVYNIAGQLVKSFSGQGTAGPNAVTWNTGNNGAGVYFFQLASGGKSATRKMVVVK